MTYNRLTDEALLNLLFTEEDRLPRAAADGFVARAHAAREGRTPYDFAWLWNELGLERL